MGLIKLRKAFVGVFFFFFFLGAYFGNMMASRVTNGLEYDYRIEILFYFFFFFFEPRCMHAIL